MYREVVVGGSLLVALLLGIPIAAKANELAEAQTLYEKHCSTCHGLIVPDTAHGFNLPEPPSTAHLPVLATSQQYLVFAPPYGPPLRGVYARVAGSVKGFSYSRAFKEALQGVVWNHTHLDRWITDSQAWVPGSRMFYQQPDAEIRHKIITYLEANR
jgi:cytochrome c2